ncbi:MAG: hypothetical protein JSR61_22500 [Proteobacteria bacterium]|nr:hypothetical protein [Pseudomonadota bacterium]
MGFLVQRLKDFFFWSIREGKSALAKEALKYIALWLGSLFLAALVGVANRLVKNRAITIEEIRSGPFDFLMGLIRESPVHSFSVLFFVAVVVVFIFLLRRARWRFNEQSKLVKEGEAAKALATEAGLGGRWPHAKHEDGGAPWGDLCAEITRPENNILYILGANGIDTFGRPGSPLYSAMRQFPGTIRAILIRPNSDEVRGRSQAVGMDTYEYNSAIRTSVSRLRELKRQQHSVEGRYYDGQLNWKLIITNRTIWVQYYLPGAGHVDSTPVWRLDSTASEGSFYRYFYLEFDRIWRRCQTFPMELD